MRSEIKKGNREPSISSSALFNDDVYLKPVLDDDALLYSLDDLTDDVEVEDGKAPNEKRILEQKKEKSKKQTLTISHLTHSMVRLIHPAYLYIDVVKITNG